MTTLTNNSPSEITFEKPSWAHLLVLEQIEHPSASGKPLTSKDLMTLVYVFHNSQEAFDAFAKGREYFERNALELARAVPLEQLPSIIERVSATMIASTKEFRPFLEQTEQSAEVSTSDATNSEPAATS